MRYYNIDPQREQLQPIFEQCPLQAGPLYTSYKDLALGESSFECPHQLARADEYFMPEWDVSYDAGTPSYPSTH